MLFSILQEHCHAICTDVQLVVHCGFVFPLAILYPLHHTKKWKVAYGIESTAAHLKIAYTNDRKLDASHLQKYFSENL